jgi:hypothetical protein
MLSTYRLGLATTTLIGRLLMGSGSLSIFRDMIQ